MTTAAQHARWREVGNYRGPKGKGRAHLAAMHHGANFSRTIERDNATRDLAEADELRAPGWLSHEDMQREMGERR